MRKWNVVAMLLAIGFMLSPFATAQSDDDLRQEVEQLKRDLRTVMSQNQRILAENVDLRTTATVEDSALEQRINALAESLDYAAGTTVNSVANPITFTGEFRVRSGWTIDRDFGGGTFNSSSNNNDADDDGSFQDAYFQVGLTFDFSRDVTTYFSIRSNGLFNNNDTPDSGSSSSGGSSGGGPFSGSSSSSSGSSGRSLTDLELDEAWILTRNLFGRKELSAKTGRQTIVLGNEFIFGDNDFFSGETHDGTHWLWSSENFDLHFIFAKLDISESLNTRDHPFVFAFDGSDNTGFDDDELYAVYFTLNTIKDHVLDLFWVYFNGNSGGSFGTLGNPLGTSDVNGVAKGGFGSKFYHHTVGFRLGGVFNVAAGLDYNINFAYQFGDIKDSSDTDAGGLAVEVEVGITFDANNNFRLYARFLFSEGGEDGDSGFIHLFPERHSHGNRDDHTAYRARYGIMDIIPLHNVLSIQVGVTFDPSADWTLGLTVLYATTDEDVSTPTGEEDQIGFEIDIFAEYRYSAETTFSAGIGFFFPDDAAPLKTSGSADFAGSDNDDVAVLFYVQTQVVF